MDEVTLNDLLECSVCLERLDTTSRVLPCQHTFCRKCLEIIVASHNELRCPECRVLINIKIDDLPPNVLLMRILEGIKNSSSPNENKTIPVKQTSSINSVHPNSTKINKNDIIQDTNEQNNKIQHQNYYKKQVNIPHAKALYDFVSKEISDLSFQRGDIIYLIKRLDLNWYVGELKGKHGTFPANFVQVIVPLPFAQCKALYDFRMGPNEEEGCLTFKKGAIINVFRRVDQNWAEGRIGDCIGIFPIAFVEMNDVAKQIIDTTTNKYFGLQYVISTRNVPSIPTDIRQSSSDTTSSSTINSSNSNSNTSSSSSTAPNSPITAATYVNTPITVQTSRNNDGKRHSLTTFTNINRTTDKKLSEANRHSVEILTRPDSEPTTSQTSSTSASTSNIRKETTSRVNLSQTTNDLSKHSPHFNSAYVARYAYKPQRPDELELKKGSIYFVTERCRDGWFKGYSRANKSKTGVFPGNFVTSLITSSSNIDHMNHMKSLINPQPLPPELPPRNNLNSISTGRKSLNPIQKKNEVKQQNIRGPISQTKSSSSIPTVIKDKKESSSTTMNLMKRLANIKRSKSPPTQIPTQYLMDNPVFEDNAPGPSSATAPISSSSSSSTSVSRRNIQLSHPVHVRSGSCPSQLLQNLSITETKTSSTTENTQPQLFGSQRIKGHKERPMLPGWHQMDRFRDNLNGRPNPHNPGINIATDIPLNISHRKTQSLDAGTSPIVNNALKPKVYPLNEKFKCIVSYPPNSEFELELNVGDIIFVHKKRDNGWYKGTHLNTGKVGLFPASFVERVN